MRKFLNKIIKGIKNPYSALLVLLPGSFWNRFEDEKYLRFVYRARIGKPLNLEAPRTFNEKLQWMKLYDRKPEYTMMADKYAVREYVAKTIGEEYLIPLLGVWDDPDEIDFDALPDQFVLKCNHNSGLGMCICKDKSKLDIENVKVALRKGLQQDYYKHGREWPYKNISRKIVCEEFLIDDGKELADYKVHNFNGEPKFILVCRDRFGETGLTEDFFTETWDHMDVKRPNIPNAKNQIPKPEELEQMLQLSKKLAAQIPFARTDFYIVNHKIYFGEITFFPASGTKTFEPEHYDALFGSWIILPERTDAN